jgi:hypothetical protein
MLLTITTTEMVTVNPFDQDFLFEIMDLNSFFIDCALFVASPPLCLPFQFLSH